MNCRECQKHLSEYVDNRLAPARRNQVDAHRSECAACERQYRLMQRAGEVLGREAAAEPPAGLAERASRAAFAAAEPRAAGSFFDRWIPVAWPTAVVAAAAAVLLLVTSAPQSGGAPSPTGDPVSIVLDDAGDDGFEGDVLGMEEDDEN